MSDRQVYVNSAVTISRFVKVACLITDSYFYVRNRNTREISSFSIACADGKICLKIKDYLFAGRKSWDEY